MLHGEPVNQAANEIQLPPQKLLAPQHMWMRSTFPVSYFILIQRVWYNQKHIRLLHFKGISADIQLQV
jgi:hypothetical protein